MAEYIKKSIAIAIVSDSADMYPFEKNEAIRRIEDSTPADVAPVVHGNWILEEVDYGISPITNEKVISSKYKCSNCGYETGKQAEKFVCCPLCTARMRKDG